MHLQNINTITIDGGTVNGAIDAGIVDAAVTFNLTSGLIRGGVTGTSIVDNFVIGADITINGVIDGGLGADTLSFATGFTPTSVNFFDNALTLGLADGSRIEFTLANIAMADIDVGSLTLTTRVLPLTFRATAEADTFAISSDITDSTNLNERQLESVIDGLGGTDEFQLNTDAVVVSVSFDPATPTVGDVHLQNIETITLNGGQITGQINAAGAGVGVRFNLQSGLVGEDSLLGSPHDDTFTISGDITGAAPLISML